MLSSKEKSSNTITVLKDPKTQTTPYIQKDFIFPKRSVKEKVHLIIMGYANCTH